jgi:hypothetical protein
VTLRTVHPAAAVFSLAPVTLLVGVEDLPDGRLFVYLGTRGRNLGVVVADEDNIAAARAAWAIGGHVFLTMPPAEAIVNRRDV